MQSNTTAIPTITDAFGLMLFELIQNLTRDVDPQTILRQMTGAIQKVTDSDRVNLHYIKRTAAGPMVFCWDNNPDCEPVGPFTLSKDEGLISWALEHNEWILDTGEWGRTSWCS